MCFFDDETNLNRLREILNSWLGTPFRHLCGVKGLGVDCSRFVFHVLEELDLVSWRENTLPRHPRRWYLHNPLFDVVALAKELVSLEDVKKEDIVNGDIVVYKIGRCPSHFGIYLDDYVYMSLERIGVSAFSWSDEMWFKRVAHCLRVMG